MRSLTPARRTLLVMVVAITPCLMPCVSQAQGATTSSASPSAGALTPADLRTLAEAHVAISLIHDSSDTRAAQAKNKTASAQDDLATRKRDAILAVLKAKGLAEPEYQRRRFLVSADDALRTQFDSVVALLTGAPLPGRIVVAAAPGFVPASALPPGMVGSHLGHVVTSYPDTPDRSGLLPMAFVEAQIASQHAALAARAPTDLAAMQLHAGHVLHAIDPTIVTTGPGKGYGMRKAAAGVANHVELAAREPGASPNVKVHAVHIATAARATMARADQVIALAKQIQGATDAKTAASLLAQLVPLCAQLAAGTDVNHDGRIDWSDGEGGLQQAQEHLQLLLAGEKR
jgi:hypothetical protein